MGGKQDQDQKGCGSCGGVIMAIIATIAIIAIPIIATVALVREYGIPELPPYVLVLLVVILWICAIVAVIWVWGFVNNFWLSHWHGMVQAGAVFVTLIVLGVLFRVMNSMGSQIHDLILAGGTVVALAVAIIFSHAYNYVPGAEKESLRNRAAKVQSTWLHAHYCWKVAGISMALISIYCNCVTIYVGIGAIGENWAQYYIILYSALSLAFSVSAYVLRPSNRAAGFQGAYLAITKVLIKDDGSSEYEKEIKEAMIEGELLIARAAE